MLVNLPKNGTLGTGPFVPFSIISSLLLFFICYLVAIRNLRGLELKLVSKIMDNNPLIGRKNGTKGPVPSVSFLGFQAGD